MVNYFVGIVFISLVSSGYGLSCSIYGVDLKDNSDEVAYFKIPTEIVNKKCETSDSICVSATITNPDGSKSYESGFCADKDFSYKKLSDKEWKDGGNINPPRADDIKKSCSDKDSCNDPETQCLEYGVETDAETGKPNKIKEKLTSINRLCPAAKCVSGWVRYDNDNWQHVGYCAQLDNDGNETFMKDDLKKVAVEIKDRTIKDAYVKAACPEKICNELATDIECLQYGATLTESGVISENNDINNETSGACSPWSPTCIKGTLSYKKNESTIPIEVCSAQSNCDDFVKTIKEKNADIKDLTCEMCKENCNQSTSTSTSTDKNDGGDDGGDNGDNDGDNDEDNDGNSSDSTKATTQSTPSTTGGAAAIKTVASVVVLLALAVMLL